MSLIVSNDGGNFELVPEGQYVARCFKVIELGTQWVEWQGNKKEQKKVLVMWEILDDKVKMADGKPFAITKRYTASLDERSALFGDLEAWRGKKFTTDELKGFDLTKVLGAYCNLQIVHSEDGKYANINSIMGFKGEKPKGINELVSFDIDNPDMKIFDSFSDKLKEQIEKAPEFRIATGKKEEKLEPTTVPAKEDVVITDIGEEEINLDDIPF